MKALILTFLLFIFLVNNAISEKLSEQQLLMKMKELSQQSVAFLNNNDFDKAKKLCDKAKSYKRLISSNANIEEIECSYFRWIIELNQNEIVPNSGMAGINLNDSIEKAINILGPPASNFPILCEKNNKSIVANYENINANEHSYFLLYYVYKRVGLQITADNNKHIKQFWLFDTDLNIDNKIPKIKNTTISIGDSITALGTILGNPIIEFSDYQIGGYFWKGIQYQENLTEYKCNGISFEVRVSTNKINSIKIW